MRDRYVMPQVLYQDRKLQAAKAAGEALISADAWDQNYRLGRDENLNELLARFSTT
jgi:hypothetical protein